MKPLQSLLALVLSFALGCGLALPAQASSMEDSASRDLIATIEKAREVRQQADSKLRKISS